MNTRQTLCWAVFLFFSFQIKAQFRDFMTYGGEWYSPQVDVKKQGIFSINTTLGLTSGLGVEAAFRFNPRVVTRIALNYTDLKLSDYKLSFGSTASKQDVLFDVNVQQSHLAGFIDYSVAPKFRFWGGVQGYFKNTVSVGGELSGIIKVNDVSLNSNDLGSGILTMGFKTKLTPSVGIGFGRVIPNKKMSFSLDIGAQYRGNYTFDIKIKEGLILKKNEENARILERNFNKNWYNKMFPMLQLRCSFNFKNKKQTVVEDFDEE
jgi:hypothetical protein